MPWTRWRMTGKTLNAITHHFSRLTTLCPLCYIVCEDLNEATKWAVWHRRVAPHYSYDRRVVCVFMWRVAALALDMTHGKYRRPDSYINLKGRWWKNLWKWPIVAIQVFMRIFRIGSFLLAYRMILISCNISYILIRWQQMAYKVRLWCIGMKNTETMTMRNL